MKSYFEAQSQLSRCVGTWDYFLHAWWYADCMPWLQQCGVAFICRAVCGIRIYCNSDRPPHPCIEHTMTPSRTFLLLHTVKPIHWNNKEVRTVLSTVWANNDGVHFSYLIVRCQAFEGPLPSTSFIFRSCVLLFYFKWHEHYNKYHAWLYLLSV